MQSWICGMELLKASTTAVKRMKTQRDVLARALSSELQRTTTTSSDALQHLRAAQQNFFSDDCSAAKLSLTMSG